MAILIDPPMWPAHGTVFSHLVSDSSLEELHAFAQAAELPHRAFDRDHYDVPLARYDELVSRGAEAVQGTELVRRLVRSGLRVPARQRPEKLNSILMRRWNQLAPGHEDVGRALVARWSHMDRHYHSSTHLLAVLNALELLSSRSEDPGTYPSAQGFTAWYHDAIYNGVPGTDEEQSAELAAAEMSQMGVDAPVIDETVRLILLTKTHDPDPDDQAGKVFVDADLEVLARAEKDYRRYTDDVREEYRHVPDELFREGRAKILQDLLDKPHLFETGTGRTLWESRARLNLQQELRELRNV
ncbi:putative metal-dependent HD superfamily phosphohydrolase [Neomicrococcus aestuarii]|uniref:Putative metal-dependent HD superfamily phosphohydrolase n=1 Tax=Neomicrococcus aestuarii TaxID=556325 RepID=A0A7W8TUG2_9MICC|nr:DUF4031 domain-containing protein [Neomicrococcus aestuarii]MBB5512320.1 putative metal-dependent HD superfamily phosphohydrolase [Neomicrococcus aestuarii]